MRIPLLILVLAAAGFGAELNVDKTAVTDGKPAALSIHLQSGASELTGIQFEVDYDASRFDVTLEVGPAATGAQKVLESNALQPGKQRVLIFGFNRNRITDGVVAIAHVSLKGAPDTSQSDLVRLSKSLGTNESGETVPVTVHGGVAGSQDAQSATRGEAR
ncbi:MAG TPA: cohesin domain-containing protein [Bryobacteraceae bacterium]|nr:cohesin domain-containing protein [Bryobacteraceae bacterium]